jgi:outer membrane biosynthesis protein TonB
MNNFFEILDKYKYPILAVLFTFFGSLFYLLFNSYEKSWEVDGWDFNSQVKVNIAKDELEIKPEDIEILSNNAPKEVKSIARDMNDQRQKTMKEDWSTSKPMSSKDVEKSVKELEKQFFKEAGGEGKRQKIIEEKIQNEQKIKQKQQNTKTSDGDQQNRSGGDKVYGGNVMVNWVLSGREPHEGINSNIRNPGYTCGSGSSGVVLVKIKVDQGGNVVSATVTSSSNANSCMIEQAKHYALISRFNYAKSAPITQEGTIKYTFVSQ